MLLVGTSRADHLDDAVSATRVELSADELAEIERIAPPGAAAGARYPEDYMARLGLWRRPPPSGRREPAHRSLERFPGEGVP